MTAPYRAVVTVVVNEIVIPAAANRAMTAGCRAVVPTPTKKIVFSTRARRTGETPAFLSRSHQVTAEAK